MNNKQIPQHRSLQLELRTLLDEKAKKLKRQNQMINVLQEDHQTLKTEIETLMGGTHARKNVNVSRKLFSLDMLAYNRKIHQLKNVFFIEKYKNI